MFFRSQVSLIIAGILILFGCAQFFISWRCAGASRPEATTVGVIYNVIGGKGSTYEYVFKIDGVQLRDESGSCHTALTLQGCKVGAPVLVYYVHQPGLETRLQEFGDASREKLFTGIWLVSFGLLLIGMYFFLQRTAENSGESEDPDESARSEEPEVLHIVPSE
jgi:hypothetical protein